MVGLDDIAAAFGEDKIPDGERPAKAEIGTDLSRQIRLMRRRHFLHVEIVERAHILIGELGIGRVGHCRIEPVTVLGDAAPERSIEITQRIIANTSFAIWRDIRRVNRAKRAAHFETARKRLAARYRMARDAVAGTRKIFAAGLGSGSVIGMRCRCTGQKEHQQGADNGPTNGLLAYRHGVVPPGADSAGVVCDLRLHPAAGSGR